MLVQELIEIQYYLIRSFLYLPKEKNQQRSGERKGSLSLAAALLVLLRRTSLCCSNWPGACGTRYNHFFKESSNSPRAYPANSVLLGCVKWL